jgi:hypothetical protein
MIFEKRCLTKIKYVGYLTVAEHYKKLKILVNYQN